METRYQVVVFAENAYYYQYFRHLVNELVKAELKICYITSDSKDPLFGSTNERMDVVYSKSTLAFLFRNLQAEVVIMTMPDLQHFIFKRSKRVKKYIYVFHALVSIHQQYRNHAFDHYDTFFCAGPHHAAELREAEKLYALAPRELIPYGYPLLHDLEKKYRDPVARTVLIAPSWYEGGILDTCIGELITALSALDYEIVLRPHPEYIKRRKKEFTALKKLITRFPQMSLDLQPQLYAGMMRCRHLITDRSGIAFEFAFARQMPVVFIDTAPKVQNAERDRFQNKPVENEYRREIGITVPPDQVGLVASAILDAENNTERFRLQIGTIKKEVVYDSSSLSNGIQYIRDQVS